MFVMLLVLLACTRSLEGDSGDPVDGDLEIIESGQTTCDPGGLPPGSFAADSPGDWANQVIDFKTKPGQGLVVADLDGDGNVDVFLPNGGADQLLMGLDDGSFVDETDGRWPALPADVTLASTAVDFDGDGDFDLLSLNEDQGNKLFENDGTGVFVDITGLARWPGGAYASRGSAWADFDGDGDLDAFVSNHTTWNDLQGEPIPDGENGDPNVLIENRGDGTFLDVSERLPEEMAEGFTQIAAAIDVDSDGWVDLHVVNEHRGGQPDFLLRNSEGVFLADDSSGTQVETAGMGQAVGDINGDGVPDFLVTGWSEVFLLESVGAEWFDASQSREIRPRNDGGRHVGRAAEFADVDNDGDLDVLIAFAYKGVEISEGGEDPKLQPDGLYIQQPDGTFEQQAEDWGIGNPGRTWAMVPVDLDRDGTLDLITRPIDGPAKLYRGACSTNAWLEVSLRSGGANTFAVGAKVELAAGDLRATRWVVLGGTGMASSPPLDLHFGLGTTDGVDEMVISWPDGHRSVLRDLAARQHITIMRR